MTRAARASADVARVSGGGRDALSLATAAFVRADYDACRILLGVASDRGTPAAALIEARCARAQDDVATWATAAARVAKDHPDPGARLEGAALHALATIRQGNDADGRAGLARVRKSVDARAAGSSGWAAFYLAFDALARDDDATAETYLAPNIASDAGAASLALLGEIESKRERYRKAGAHYFEALRRATSEGDVRLAAAMLRAASDVAAETADLRLGRKVHQEADAFVWPDALQADRFDTLANLRALALLEGDVQRAWLYAREAAVCAPDPARRAIGETQGSHVSRLLGNGATSDFQLERAWQLLRTLRSGAAPAADARTAYATFAAEAARTQTADARKALAAGVALAAKDGRSVARDSRLVALEAFAAGRVAEALDHPERALVAYERAFEIWQALKFDQRAAIVAFDLRRLVRDDRYDAFVETFVARVPDAWFAAASPADDVLDRLTPAETRVLGLLLEGKSARAIADDLGRSVHTVNNHTRKVFKAFDLTSRAAVLARCTELGITVQSLRR